MLHALTLALHGGSELSSRLLRLALVASVALPILTALMARARRQRGQKERLEALILPLALVGAALMPTVLAAAALVTPLLKYLLPIPALSMTGAALLTTRATLREGFVVEGIGWSLISLSFMVGLTMGLYAFDGPLPTPALVGAYQAPLRTVLREGHAIAVILGALTVAAAQRRSWGLSAPARRQQTMV